MQYIVTWAGSTASDTKFCKVCPDMGEAIDTIENLLASDLNIGEIDVYDIGKVLKPVIKLEYTK